MQRRGNNVGAKIDDFDRMGFLPGKHSQRAARGLSSQPWTTVAGYHRKFARFVAQCFGNPVDTIEDVICFHPKMQRHPASYIQQSMALQIFDLLLIGPR